MFPIKIKNKAEKVVKVCLKKKIKLEFAESCTGGLLSSLITSFPNSSKIFSCGYVTYSNLSKEKMLGIPKKKLKKYGAVSMEIAGSMAESVLLKANANIGIGITGIAGPGGATRKKKVGEVYVSLCHYKNKKFVQSMDDGLSPHKGTRESIRLASVNCALNLLLYICTRKTT